MERTGKRTRPTVQATQHPNVTVLLSRAQHSQLNMRCAAHMVAQIQRVKQLCPPHILKELNEWPSNQLVEALERYHLNPLEKTNLPEWAKLAFACLRVTSALALKPWFEGYRATPPTETLESLDTLLASNEVWVNGWELLHSAVYDNDLSLCNHLLRRPDVNLDAPSDDGDRPLHYSYYFGSKSLKKIRDRLIQAGADVNASDRKGRTALHMNVYDCDYNEDQLYLLERGADPNIADNQGNTPLHLAYYSPKTVSTLLFYGASVHQKNHQGRSPLFKALQCVDHDGNDCEEALATLSEYCEPELFLEKDSSGRSPLDYMSRDPILRLYLRLFAPSLLPAPFDPPPLPEPNSPKHMGRTPLHRAIIQIEEHPLAEEVLRPLLEEGWRVEAKDTLGRNALHWAAIFPDRNRASEAAESIHLLLDHGAEATEEFKHEFCKAVGNRDFNDDTILNIIIELGQSKDPV